MLSEITYINNIDLIYIDGKNKPPIHRFPHSNTNTLNEDWIYFHSQEKGPSLNVELLKVQINVMTPNKPNKFFSLITLIRYFILHTKLLFLSDLKDTVPIILPD